MLALPVAALLALPAPAPAGERSVPQGFLGVTADGPVFEQGVDADAEFDVMVKSGVETVRAAVYWHAAQPYRRWADVPAAERAHFEDAGGVPTDWRVVDALVGRAATRGLEVLPTVLWAPVWARLFPDTITSPPENPPYAAFVAQLARRYGPRGTFWGRNPEVPRRPVRAWQVWNEPTIRNFWSLQPFARRYASLLRATRRALRKADPAARIISAGFVYESWLALEELYRVGGRGTFDAVAVHPFTRRIDDTVAILENVRDVMARYGDRRLPLFVTELSYPSSLGRTTDHFGYETNERGQATRLARALERLAAVRRRLRLERVLWYSWLSPDRGDYPFYYAGLRRFDGSRVTAKPALAAFRRTALRLEGCASKAAVATRCAR